MLLAIATADYPSYKNSSEALSLSTIQYKISIADLAHLYKQFIHSAKYLDYQVHQSNFAVKMNSKVSGEFKSNASLLMWIKNNLRDTKFETYDEALEEFTILTSKFDKLTEEHSDFFSAVIAAGGKDFAQVVSTYSSIPESGTEDDCATCLTSYNATVKGAAIKYSRYLKNSDSASVAIELGYYMDRETCKAAREYCLIGCD
jgi:hypothetical protein